MRRILSPVVALLLVVAAVSGAVAYGPEPAQDLNPTQEVDAALPLYVGGLVVVGAAGAAASYFGDDSPSEEELEKADAVETKTEIYSQASTVAQSADNLDTAMNNYLEDTRSIARMEGKNAYIRALNNDTSEAASRTAARGAIEDYYSGRQLSPLNSWNTTQISFYRMSEVAANTSDVSTQFASFTFEKGQSPEDFPGVINATETSTEQLTLVNGSTRQAVTLGVTVDGDTTSHMGLLQDGSLSVGTKNLRWQKVQAPTESYEQQMILDIRNNSYRDKWTSIETQNQEVQGNVDEFINSTYDAYQQGEINSSDLVDPYLSARDYSPEGESSIWTLRTLTAMGMSPPDNLDNFREMTIGYAGSNETGVLLSDGLPENDQFDVGTTYNTGDLTGEQIMLDTDTGERLELAENEEFEVLSATDADGEQMDNVTYRSINYEASSTDEYAQLQSDLANTSAEIEALQSNLRDTGPGFGIGGGGASLVGGIIVVGGVVWLLSRD